MNVIGLGKAGCNIAKNFNQYPEYNVYQIDVGKEGPQCYDVKKQKGPEEYEATAPSFKKFLANVQGEALFIIGGSGDISAMSLRIIEEIRHK